MSVTPVSGGNCTDNGTLHASQASYDVVRRISVVVEGVGMGLKGEGLVQFVLGDPFAMAKAGDLEGLKMWSDKNPDFDFVNETDGFDSMCLYYSCHSGASRGIEIVRWLLGKGEYSESVVRRCVDNAINGEVRRLLKGAEVGGSTAEGSITAGDGNNLDEGANLDGVAAMFGDVEGGGDY